MRSVLAVLGIAVLAILVAVLATPSKNLTPQPQEREEQRRAEQDKKDRQQVKAPGSDAFNPPRAGVVTAVMSVKDRGDVTMEFYPKAAPKTVEKFVRLIKGGFYTGMKFHRVVPDFVVQCGEPASRAQPFADTKLAEENIPFETNTLQHVPGTLGVALLSPSSNTGTSQFFINLKANHNLDAQYCVFGKVTQGMDVVSKIKQDDVINGITIR